MKNFLLIPIMLLAGCASERVVKMPPPVSGRVLPPEQQEAVRYPESVKAYPVGRYVDPNNRFVMHEQHTIYRVETTTKWNLHPDGSPAVSLGPPVAIVDSAKCPAPVNAEVIAEVNKQRAATQALLDQNARLNRSFSQLTGAFAVLKQVSEQNLQLKQELTTAEKRMDALEEALRNKQADSIGTNKNTATNEW